MTFCAKDDAAGQAIANRLSAQITGLGQAQRNSNDGISAAQTAEGGLDQVNDNLQRIRELSVQAQNDTNSQDDLTSIQDEIGQRLNEIDRISRETDFNGTKVLASDEALTIQVGADDGQTIDVKVQEINAGTLNLQGFNVDGAPSENSAASLEDVQAEAGDRISTNTTDPNADFELTTENEALGGGEVLAQLSSGDTVTYAGTNLQFADVSANAVNSITADGEGNFEFDTTIDAGDVAGADTLNLTPNSGEQEVTFESGGDTTTVTIDSAGNVTTEGNDDPVFITDSGQITNQGGSGTTEITDADVLAQALNNDGDLNTANDFDVDGTLTATLADGTEISNQAATAVSGGTGVNIVDATVSASDFIAAAESSSNPIKVATGDINSDGTLTGNIDVNSATSVTDPDNTNEVVRQDSDSDDFAATRDDEVTKDLYELDDGTFNTVENGNGSTLNVTASGELTFDVESENGRTADPLETLDNALRQVDSLRSELGAVQNRFESAITNLNTNEINLSAARSRIEDADYAAEVANQTKNQILQQAGTSTLAQANQIPQNVLSLLG